MTVERSLPKLATTPGRLHVRARRLTVMALLLTAAALGLPWVQTADGHGQVIPLSPRDRAQRVDAPVSGRISGWEIIEGDLVKKGDVLATLIDIDPSYFARLEANLQALKESRDAAQAQVNAYGAQLKALREAGQLKVDAARQRTLMAKQKQVASAQSADAAAASHEVAKRNARRIGELVKEGLTSERKFELAELKVAETAADLNKAQATLKEMEASVLAYRAAIKQNEAEVLVKVASNTAAMQKAAQQVAKATKELTEMEIKVSRQASQVVAAPTDGSVLWVNHELSGGIAKKGERLVVIVPTHAQPAVELWMDGSDLPLLQVGRDVRLQFEGWPAVQFDGWPSVAVGNFPGVVRSVDSASQQEGRFRVVVVPPEEGAWPSTTFLSQGVRVRGVVLLDEVSVGFELWRLVNDFPPRLKNAAKPVNGAPKARSGAKE